MTATAHLRRTGVGRVRSRRPAPGFALSATLIAALALAGCSSEETVDTPAAPAAASGAAAGESPPPTEQVVASAAPATGEACTATAYGATAGLDLTELTVGFAQSEKEANPFRTAETQSIRDEAKKLGVKKLLVTNAQSELSKQITDIQTMINQGAQALIIAPLNSTGLEPALAAAKAKKIPVIAIDRKLDGAAPCSDFLTFIGSDFVSQGERAAEAMIKATGGTAKVAILLGSSGNNVTTDRTSGFKDGVAGTEGIEIVAEQTGEFSREKGQTVTDQLLTANPELTAIYAENDEMALGAITAIKAAGKKPGVDIKIVSIDGTRNAVQAIVDGSINAVIESNPRFGPLAFKTLSDFYAGTGINADTIISDREYDAASAAASLNAAY